MRLYLGCTKRYWAFLKPINSFQDGEIKPHEETQTSKLKETDTNGLRSVKLGIVSHLSLKPNRITTTLKHIERDNGPFYLTDNRVNVLIPRRGIINALV